MNFAVRALRRAIAPISRTRWFRRIGPRWLPPAERFLARVTRGRLQVSGILVPSLVLHTTGAKSGTERDTVLMYTPDTDTTSGHPEQSERPGRRRAAIVAGTSFARERHPAWTYNLLAHPDAAVSVRGRRYPVWAELMGDDERDAAWARIEAQWPGYRGYERDSGRTVRLFRLRTQDNTRPF